MKNQILVGDSLEVLATIPAQSVNCVVTSPPYFALRDYGVEGQIGLESSPDEYITKLVGVFDQVRRVLRDDGVMWLNIGDSYNQNIGKGFDTNRNGDKYRRRSDAALPHRIPWGKPKELLGIPWMLVFALRDAGWFLRQSCIWHKPNPMPESVRDRCTKAHEDIFLFTKSESYFWNYEAIQEPASGLKGGSCFGKQSQPADGTKAQQRRYERPEYKTRNPRSVWREEESAYHDIVAYLTDHHPAILDEIRSAGSVWSIATQPFKGKHFACFPKKLAERCILAGCPEGGLVLDPFAGAGTTCLVAEQLGREWIGIELNPEYAQMARERIRQETEG